MHRKKQSDEKKQPFEVIRMLKKLKKMNQKYQKDAAGVFEF